MKCRVLIIIIKCSTSVKLRTFPDESELRIEDKKGIGFSVLYCQVSIAATATHCILFLSISAENQLHKTISPVVATEISLYKNFLNSLNIIYDLILGQSAYAMLHAQLCYKRTTRFNKHALCVMMIICKIIHIVCKQRLNRI